MASRLGPEECRALIKSVLSSHDEEGKSEGNNNATLLKRIAERLERVGLSFPGVEVRFLNLTAEVEMPARQTGIPTVSSSLLDLIKAVGTLGLRQPRTQRHVMLESVSGVLRPGRLTLLLGPPGSGRTTLLRSLANQMRDNKAVKFTGDITYNGLTPGEDFVTARTAFYVDQQDVHIPELTVGQTLRFADTCLGPGMSEVLHEVIVQREKEKGLEPDAELDKLFESANLPGHNSVLVEIFTQLLGIDHVLNTVVGNELIKGISGGQKRRVTSAEMVLGLAPVMFMDEITTGLDSATAFQIVRALRNMCVYTKATYLISLLQPPPETYALFDDIILMAGRRIVYHGPREDVLTFFSSLHLTCPVTMQPADFLQEVVTESDQHKFWTKKGVAFTYQSPKRIAAAFAETEHGKAELQALHAPPHSHELQDWVLHKEEYALKPWDSFKEVLKREVQLLVAEKMMFFANIFQSAFVGFLVATTFPKLPKDDFSQANLYLSISFINITEQFMGGFNFAPTFCGRLPTFFRQRSHNFFPVWAYTLAGTLMRIPEHFLGCTVYALIVYFSVGFVADAGRFFIHLVIMVTGGMFSSAMFQLLGAVTRSEVLAQGLGAVALLLGIAVSGFPIARTSIGGWWIWLYWVFPLSWTIRAMAINEMMSDDWNTSAAPVGPEDERLGEFTLKYRGIYTESKWIWAGIVYQLCFYLLLVFLQAVALTYLGPVIINKVDAGQAAGTAADSTGSEAAEIQLPRASTALRSRSQSLPSPEDGHQLAIRNPSATLVTAGSRKRSIQDDMELGMAAQKGTTLPFKPMVLAFKGINYFVPKPGGKGEEELQLLRGVSGSFRPGVLTALMGASGAGKTTLMDVLADRKTGGRAEGTQTLNGRVKIKAEFARIMGYVEQLDVHVAQTTVHEALLFSAQMRLGPTVDKDAMNAFVKEVMSIVELTPLANKMVGMPGAGTVGLATEQRKRLTIGVELVANPSVVFMDEPTSGLDARAAAVVMRAVRNSVNTGRTVVCTIHQPNRDIFEAFDELLLLKPGGRVIYNGPLGGNGAQDLVAHFTSFEGIEPPADSTNRADWMLEVSGPQSEQAGGFDWGERWESTPQAKEVAREIEELCEIKDDGSASTMDAGYALAFPDQLRMLLYRGHRTYWRLPSYNVLRILITLVMGFFFGTLFLNRGSKRTTILGVLDMLGALYTSTIFMGMANGLIVLPVVYGERSVVYRERASRMYSTLAYTLAQGWVELPYLLVQGLVYTIIIYFLINFERDAAKFFWFYVFMQFNLLTFTFLGVGVQHCTPSIPASTAVLSFFVLFWNNFCGFILYRKEIYGWYLWAYYFNPPTYVLYGTIITQLGNVHDEFLNDGTGEVSVAQYISSTFSYKYEWRGYMLLVLVGFLMASRILAYWGLSTMNFQKR